MAHARGAAAIPGLRKQDPIPIDGRAGAPERSIFDEKRWRDLFVCVDAEQAQQFIAYLYPDSLFRDGSSPPAIGHAAIAIAVDGLFDISRPLAYHIGRSWHEPGSAICQGEVTYVLKDGRQFTLPFCHVLAVAGGKIWRDQIYIDPSPPAPVAAA